MKLSIKILITAFLIQGSALAFEKVGTTAAQFLQIGVGGRLTSMAGAGVAVVDGADALYWNPAGIAGTRKLSLSVYRADWLAEMQHQYIGFTYKINDNSAVGFFALSLGGDEFEQTTLSFQEGNGVMVEYGDLALGASFARQLTSRFSFGMTVKYIRQKLFHESASTIAFDFGTRLNTDLPGFSIGMAMTNLGGQMKLEGRDLLTSGPEETAAEYQMSEWPLPLKFAVGAGWRLYGLTDALHDGTAHGLTITTDGTHLNEGLTRWRMGVEYDYRQTVYLRGGQVIGHDTEEFTFGAGLIFPAGKFTMTFDFAYADMGDLGGVERISIGLR